MYLRIVTGYLNALGLTGEDYQYGYLRRIAKDLYEVWTMQPRRYLGPDFYAPRMFFNESTKG